MKQFKISRVLTLTVLIALLLLVLWRGYIDYTSMQVTYYDTYGIITDRVGFDTSDERIAFGKMFPGGSASRYIEIANGAIEKTGYIYVRGNITQFVTVSESPFQLKPYENKTILFLMSAPFGTYGTYQGEFKIVLKGKR